MDNEAIAQQIFEDAEIYGLSRRAAPVFEIRRLMAEKGVRSSDLAERLRVSEANVSRMLRGDQNLKIDTLYQLAGALQENLKITFTETAKTAFLNKNVRATVEDMYFEQEFSGSLADFVGIYSANDMEDADYESLIAFG